MVPVLRHSEAHDLWSSASQVARLAQDARTGKIAREEISGSTITLSSLGDLGGIVSTPVINYRSEEHTSELKSLMRISYAVFCLKKKKTTNNKEKLEHDSQRKKQTQSYGIAKGV